MDDVGLFETAPERPGRSRAVVIARSLPAMVVEARYPVATVVRRPPPASVASVGTKAS